MPNRLIVLNVVGLTPALVGENTPNLKKLMARGSSSTIDPVLPAVTCSAQASYLTGTPPSQHGIVGNGWYFHDQSEVRFWHQSSRLMEGERIWDAMRKRDPNTTAANLFWWFNMYCDADYAVTVRPMYPADGRKIPDIYTKPASWRDELNAKLGQFPLFKFWGPMANIESSEWIVNAALETLEKHQPTLSLVYLPHLDYCLQKFGPGHDIIAQELRTIDTQCGRLIAAAEKANCSIVVLSEYGIEAVDQPIHLNRALREAKYLEVREEMGRELLDTGISRAFSVADHQVAHIYVANPSDIAEVKALIEAQAGVEKVLDEQGKKEAGLDHERSGELIAIAEKGAWFTYYYWLDDKHAPDFASTVDIHRKPGYDPVELFIDPNITLPKLTTAWKLLKKKLGFRTLMDVIPMDASLVKGSHGRPPSSPEHGAFYISSKPGTTEPLKPTEVKQYLLDMIFTD